MSREGAFVFVKPGKISSGHGDENSKKRPRSTGQGGECTKGQRGVQS